MIRNKGESSGGLPPANLVLSALADRLSAIIKIGRPLPASTEYSMVSLPGRGSGLRRWQVVTSLPVCQMDFSVHLFFPACGMKSRPCCLPRFSSHPAGILCFIAWSGTLLAEPLPLNRARVFQGQFTCFPVVLDNGFHYFSPLQRTGFLIFFSPWFIVLLFLPVSPERYHGTISPRCVTIGRSPGSTWEMDRHSGPCQFQLTSSSPLSTAHKRAQASDFGTYHFPPVSAGFQGLFGRSHWRLLEQRLSLALVFPQRPVPARSRACARSRPLAFVFQLFRAGNNTRKQRPVPAAPAGLSAVPPDGAAPGTGQPPEICFPTGPGHCDSRFQMSGSGSWSTSLVLGAF